MVLGSEAELALLDALQSVGLEARLTESPHSRADIEVHTPDGRKVLIEAEYRSLASPDGLPRQLERYAHDLHRLEALEGEAVVGVLVADRVTEGARAILQKAGWGWLDLRGQLHIAAPGTYVHADIQPMREQTASSDPFGGRAGLEVSVELLLSPTDSVGVRSLARRIGRAPSTVSEVLARLRSANLIDRAQCPTIPDLFWSLASAWRPASADVKSLPPMQDQPLLQVLRVGQEDGAGIGWALTDTKAAAVYGAPIGAREDHPADIYVPDMRTLRRATQGLGLAAEPSARAATLRAAPVAAACSDRIRDTRTRDNQWPLARPLFVALDLAQDPPAAVEKSLNSGARQNPGHVSGSPSAAPVVDLVGTAMERLVHAIPVAAAQSSRPVVLIGALAVICRLGNPYRATSDVDTVDRRRNDEPSQLELLIRTGATPSGPPRRRSALVSTATEN